MIVESEHGPLGWLTVLQTIAANRPELFGRREVSFNASAGDAIYFSLDWEELSVEFVPGPAGVRGVLIKTRSGRADRALAEAATRWGFEPYARERHAVETEQLFGDGTTGLVGGVRRDGAVERFVAEYLAAEDPDKAVVLQKAGIALDRYQHEEFRRRIG